MKREKIEIKDYDDLNCIIQDMFDEFFESICDDSRFSKLATKEDIEELEDVDEKTILINSKGLKLLEKYENRMYFIFCKYFDSDLFDIYSPVKDFY